MGGRKKIPARTICLVLFAAALLLRLFYLWEARENPFFHGLGLDARYYDLRAREIVEEGLIGDEAYFMGPLYPHLLALLYGAAGRSLLLVRLLQAVISALVPVLVYRIGRRFFQPTEALVAAILAVMYGPLIFYTGSILYTTLAVTLLLFILDRLTEPAPRRPALHNFLTGLLFGLAAVGKGNVILFLPFAALAVARGTADRPRWNWRAPLLLLAGFAMIVSLTTARNYMASGDFVPLTSNGGLNFYIGNGPESSGAYEKPRGLDVDHDPSGRRMMEKRLGVQLSPTEVSRIWRKRAMEFIRKDPAAELNLLLRKTVFVLSTFEIPQIESYHFQKRYSRLVAFLFIPFGVIAPLGLAAIFRRRHTGAAPLAAFAGVYMLSIVLFFVLTRYRLPVVPVLMIYASTTLVATVHQIRRKEWGGVVRIAAWTAPFVLLCNVNFYSLSPDTGDAQSHYRLGIIRNSEGKIDEAIREYEESIRLDPNYARSRLNLGEIRAVRSETAEAEEQFRAAARIDPEYAKARLNLGTLLYRTGRVEEGRSELEKAVELDDEYGKAWLHLGAVALLSGAGDAAAFADRALKLLNPNDPSRVVAADLFTRAGEVIRLESWRASRGIPGLLPGECREALVGEILRDRENVEGLYRAGASGGDPAALYLFGVYLFKREGFEESMAILARAAEEGETMPGLRFARGVLEMKRGNAEGALREFLGETENDPSSQSAWKNAALLTARFGSPDEAARLAREFIRRGGVPDEAINALIR